MKRLASAFFATALLVAAPALSPHALAGGAPDGYFLRQASLSGALADVSIDDGCAVHARCRVGGGVRLRGTVLFEDVRVGAGAEFDACLVCPGVTVPAGKVHRDEIVGPS